jgi:hypothetical protein
MPIGKNARATKVVSVVVTIRLDEISAIAPILMM